MIITPFGVEAKTKQLIPIVCVHGIGHVECIVDNAQLRRQTHGRFNKTTRPRRPPNWAINHPSVFCLVHA